jgi:hypothetical protein
LKELSGDGKSYGKRFSGGTEKPALFDPLVMQQDLSIYIF